MPEQFKPYNFEQAQDEADKMKAKIENGEGKNYNEAEKLVEGEKIENKEIILTPERKKAIEKLFWCFNHPYFEATFNTDIITAIEIKNKFNLPEKIVREAARQGVVNHISRIINGVDRAIEIKDKFNLPEKMFVEAVKQEIITRLHFGRADEAIQIKKRLNLPEEIIINQEAQKAAERGFANQISYYGITPNALLIKEEFGLPNETITAPEVQRAIKQSLIDVLSRDNVSFALRIKNELNASEEIIASSEVRVAAKRCFANYLSKCNFGDATKVKKEFNLPEETVQEAILQGIFNALALGFPDNATKIKSEFNILTPIKEIIKQVPGFNDLIEKISELAPEFRAQVEKSDDLAMELCRFINKQDELINNIKENSFFIDAIVNNPRFSSRLLIKYPEFDDESKENIEKQFSAKKKIMMANSEMDPESLKFRQLMQTELKDFKNNPEIMAAIEKQGINLDRWLNYSETSYFNLSTGGSEIAFSEKIKTPIDRIKETIDSYAHTIKSVLKEYRPEMEKYEIILEDAGSIEGQIIKMETALEQALIEGNEKKTQGIEKGLASQKEKLNNLKKGFLWDKLTGEIAAFQRLKNDCFEAQKKLMEAENKLENALSGKMPSGKMIQDIKQVITSSKEELRSKFGDLEKRIESFKTELPNLISPCLGQERSEALIQEIDQKVAEQFNHFESDRTTVANLFSERGDKETSQLESRPMSIFVWARNPDIDLYQGNYSPCCICIDSEHMGAESTIADYNTDLGIQIINIWDEAKDEPVTAAWCWLGQNKKGEEALVIDNIESNTLYSSNFSEQLSDELFEYIEDYARKIGADKVVLGKANNDLPIGSELAKLSEDSGQYEKIGGSNRPDGYFLEAEEKSVKLVWQAEEKKVIEKKAKETPKIEFKNLKAESISNKNLAKILQAERKIYAGTGLISGQTMVEDIKRGNGFEYSVAMNAVRPGKKQAEIVAYIVAVEDETDEGDKSIYMEDIAVLPEAQRQGIGWEAMKEFINKLKAKASKDGQPVLLDMHLRETSQTFMANHHADLESLGVKLIEEALVPDYYDEGEDSLYRVYQIKAD